MAPTRFRDRQDAGRQLAARLTAYANRPDVVIRALPRGGVPVAAEVARVLHAPLDLCVVRKLGAPGNPEYAIGALAEPDIVRTDEHAIRILGLTAPTLAAIRQRELQELARRIQTYRPRGARASCQDQVVILVDDGLATGLTMQAAIAAVRAEGPAQIIVAVPVAAPAAVAQLAPEVDHCIVCLTPEPFESVGMWYEAFPQTSDDEVRALLGRLTTPAVAAPPGVDAPHSAPTPVAPAVLLSATGQALQAISDAAHHLTGADDDFTPLLARLGQARVILLGEATHGTQEFYRVRAELTKRLILEHGVAGIAIEGDWPDAYRVNTFVLGTATRDRDATEALADFVRFPQWMWRNAELLDFIGWLRSHNDAITAPATPVGFYGLDLYSLHASIAAVIAYLDGIDPVAAQRARERYACFDQVGQDPVLYGHATRLDIAHSCEQEAIAQLREMQARALAVPSDVPTIDLAARFSAEQNARVVERAEQYYRGMFAAPELTWNLRDRHMMTTLQALRAFLDQQTGTPTRLVVWAHNSHVGDARATAMVDRGEVTLGQLAREAFGHEVACVGFTTFDGTVTAASEWGGPSARMTVRPALPDSLEWLLHESGARNMALRPADTPALYAALGQPRLQRAIGVIYRPATERQSHYFRAEAAKQFDWLLHIDHTRAVEPLEHAGVHDPGELPDTYPTAL